MADCGLIYYNFPGHSLEQFATYAGQAGFQCAEIPVRSMWQEQDGMSEAEGQAAKVRQMFAGHRMRLSAVSAGNDFLQVDDAALARQVERLQTVCRLAELAGTKTVRIDGGRAKDVVPKERWFDLMVAGLRAVQPFIERWGYVPALDNHGLATNDADLQVRIFEAVGSPNIGANLDTMNYRWAGHDLETVGRYYDVIAPYVRHVHFKDGRGSRGQYRGTVLGSGEIDLERAVRVLQAAGYAGVWTVEYEGPQVDAEAGYRAGLDWLRTHIGD